jgi:hypothetical protein
MALPKEIGDGRLPVVAIRIAVDNKIHGGHLQRKRIMREE